MLCKRLDPKTILRVTLRLKSAYNSNDCSQLITIFQGAKKIRKSCQSWVGVSHYPADYADGRKALNTLCVNRWRLDTGEWFAIQLDLEWPTFVSNGYMEMANNQRWYVYP